MKLSRELKLGFIITMTIAIGIWGLNFLKGKNILTQDNLYHVIYERIDGLQESSPVLINGYKVGLVNEIRLLNDTNGSIYVKISVRENIVIPKKTTARIYSADLMGTKAIKLILGNSTEVAHSGDTLIADIEADLKEEINLQMLPLKTQAEDLMKEMQEALFIIRKVFNEKTRDNFSKSFERIENTLTSLENTTYTVDTMLYTKKDKISKTIDNIESITSNLKNNNEQITHILTNFSDISDSLAKVEFVQTIEQANLAITNANEVIEKINNGEGSVGALLNNDTLYSNIEIATDNLNKLLKDIRINPQRYLHFSAIDLGKTIYVVDDKNRLSSKRKKKNEPEE